MDSKIDILAIETFQAPCLVGQTTYLSFQERNVPGWSSALSRLIRHTGVENRYSYIPDWQEFFQGDTPTTTERNIAYGDLVYQNLIENIEGFIAIHHLNRAMIGGVITVSCTGITNPTLDTKVVSLLQCHPCIHWHIGFMGCHGGLVGLQSGAALCSLVPGKIVLVICIEACSLHYQNTLDPDIQISNALFSDGCSILALRQSDETSDDSPAVLHVTSTATQTFTEGAKYLTWNITPSGWLMGLSPKLPKFIEETLQQDAYQKFKGGKNLIVHPGGKAILRAVQEGLSTPPLHHSLSVLKRYGNMSSASIFFCLKEFLRQNDSQNEPITLMAFGPGLDVSTIGIDRR